MTGCQEPGGCPRRHYARGFCRTHYDKRFQTRVPPLPGARGVRRPRGRLDREAIDRALSGPIEPEDISRHEARYAAWVLTQEGMSAREIARRLHFSQRSINRWRAAWRQALQETP